MTIDEGRLHALDTELAAFPPTSVTARLCSALFGNLPNAPTQLAYNSFQEAADSLHEDWKPETLKRARELASTQAVLDVRMIAKSIDTGDTGLTVVTGLRSALSLFWGNGVGLVDEAQQKTDAALKALAVAFVASRMFEGTVPERLQQLRRVPAGRSLLLYYGVAEVALPFTSEVKAADGKFVHDLAQRQAASITSKLGTIVGKDGVQNAISTLDELVATLDDIAYKTADHVRPIAESVVAYLPAPLKAAGGEITDLAAIGADALPVYRYLVTRLAAEASLFRAIQELEPERLPKSEPDPEEAPTEGGTDIDIASLHGIKTAEAMADTWSQALGIEATPAAAPKARSPFAGLAAVSSGPSVDLEPVGGGEEVTETMARTDTIVSPMGLREPAVDPIEPPPVPIPPAHLGSTLVPEDFGDSEKMPDPLEPTEPAVIERAAPAPMRGLDAIEAMPTLNPELYDDDAVPTGHGIEPGLDAPDSGGGARPAPLFAAATRSPDEIIDGVFLHREEGGRLRWVVFTPQGRFSNHPPRRPTVDWEAHRGEGFLVGGYKRLEDLLIIDIAGTSTQGTVALAPTGLELDGVAMLRADHDLTGKVLSGHWRPRDGSGPRFVFNEDGTYEAHHDDETANTGTYELGRARVSLKHDGAEEVLALYTDLEPAGRTDLLCLGGEIYDREDG